MNQLVWFGLRDPHLIDVDGAGVGFFNADDMAEQYAFAGAGSPQNDENLIFLRVKAKSRKDVVAIVFFPQVPNADHPKNHPVLNCLWIIFIAIVRNRSKMRINM